ncbi:MAG: glycoside hydrolase family 3 C-terminal domain-containing protein [Oscillospiraceae bacterium]|nr:glycoside hydrolase family 3 C-terminal domain-containing protein [Oscillospiraceae bacterium]
MENRKKMSNKRFRAVLIPIMAIVVVLAIIVTVGMNAFASFFDDYLGRGTKHIVKNPDIPGESTEYYTDLYENNQESKDASYLVALQVQSEGSVLLKNNGVLPISSDTAVTPFGYRYLKPIYGQLSSSGSAKWTIDPVSPYKALHEGFSKVNEAAFDKMKAVMNADPLLEAPGTLSAGALNDLMGGDSKIYEFPASIYSGIESAVRDTVGLVFISRAGQEGSDKKYDGYEDGTPHYLALTQNELETIRFAKENCGKVVVILACSAPMEIGKITSGEYEADAILQVGHVGEKGFAALADLLTGKVNPSGRTVDIWPADFTKDPTYVNFGEFTYTNATFTSKPYGTPNSDAGNGSYYRYFVEYEEGIYIGYRYYETADVEDDTFNYDEAVVFPFGYGMSYTQFEQTITDFKDEGDEISITVSVRNKGTAAGKEVVQIYYTAPYTAFDKENRIEKSVVNLVAFEKTDILDPGEQQSVTITFLKEEMASYSYTRDNGDGTRGAYLLEAGEYIISLRSNSHDVLDTRTTSVESTIWYDASNPRKSEVDAQSGMNKDGSLLDYPARDEGESYIAASNRFEDSNAYMERETVMLTRADWKNTQPSGVADRKKEATQETVELFGIEENFDPETDPLLGNQPGSVVYMEKDRPVVNNGIILSDMRAVPYYDPMWDDFLDQVDYSNSEQLTQIINMMAGANYTTTKVDVLGLPDVIHADGANGIKAVKSNEGMELTATFGYAPLMASTWNKELMYEVGLMFGREAMENGVSGWYSPAINLHRSPFGGRVFEYYSEDPVLTGKLAAAVVSGAGDAGMYCYIKHFALNDQETHREFFLHTWATEQTMRELYLKAFEIPIKEAKMSVKYIVNSEGATDTRVMRAATAVMASQNDIGAVIAHGNYALLTQVLRNEWGFLGNVHSDMYIWMEGKNMYDLTFRSGCDTFLTFAGIGGIQDSTSPTAHAVMRRALHDVCYAVVNSSAMQGIAPGTSVRYDMSPWMMVLIAADIAVAAFVGAGVLWIILRKNDEKKNPDKYKTDEKI